MTHILSPGGKDFDMWEALALLPGADAEACRTAIADEILEPTYGLDASMMSGGR